MFFSQPVYEFTIKVSWISDFSGIMTNAITILVKAAAEVERSSVEDCKAQQESMNIAVSVPSLPVLALAVNQFQVLRLWHCGFLNEFWRLKLNYLYPQVVQMCSVFGIIYQFFEPLFNVQTKPTETCWYFRSIQYWICCGFFFFFTRKKKLK